MLDARADDGEIHDRLRRAESIGRPLGSAAFLEKLEANPPAAVVWPLRKFDKMESRSIRATVPRIVEWVRSNYEPLPSQRRWVVMVPRNPPPPPADPAGSPSG